MKIAGTVILYNPSKNIIENINSYMPYVDKIYVVDNSENQDNTNLLPKNKKVKYINNHSNLGIAKALNIACQQAIKDGYEWILTMDQDSKFKSNDLKKLIKFVENNNTDNLGIVTPYHKIETNIKKSKEEIEHPLEVMTSGNLLNLKIYSKINGFKDWLFIDCVDIDYCMNLKIHGYDIIRLNNVELEHHLGNQTIHNILGHKIICSNHPAIRRYYIARNCYYIYDMYYQYFPEHCQFIKGGLKFQIRNIILFEKNKYKKIRNMFRGIKDFKRKKKGKYPYSN